MSDRLCKKKLHIIPDGDVKCKICANNRRRDKNKKSDSIECPVCHQYFQIIKTQHVKLHGFDSLDSFKKHFGLHYCSSKSRRQKTSDTFLGKPSHKKGKPNGLRGMKRSAEARANMSKAAVKRCLRDKGALFSNVRGEWVLSEKADCEVYVRSSWEKRLLRVLDEHPDVIDLEVEPFSIPYEFDGVQYRYIPDFLVTFEGDIKELWEVKPERFLKDPRNKAKFEALNNYASKHHMNSGIITLKHIEKLEITTILRHATNPPVFGLVSKVSGLLY